MYRGHGAVARLSLNLPHGIADAAITGNFGVEPASASWSLRIQNRGSY
jgi:hypothetical protein